MQETILRGAILGLVFFLSYRYLTAFFLARFPRHAEYMRLWGTRVVRRSRTACGELEKTWYSEEKNQFYLRASVKDIGMVVTVPITSKETVGYAKKINDAAKNGEKAVEEYDIYNVGGVNYALLHDETVAGNGREIKSVIWEQYFRSKCDDARANAKILLFLAFFVGFWSAKASFLVFVASLLCTAANRPFAPDESWEEMCKTERICVLPTGEVSTGDHPAGYFRWTQTERLLYDFKKKYNLLEKNSSAGKETADTAAAEGLAAQKDDNGSGPVSEECDEQADESHETQPESVPTDTAAPLTEDEEKTTGSDNVAASTELPQSESGVNPFGRSFQEQKTGGGKRKKPKKKKATAPQTNAERDAPVSNDAASNRPMDVTKDVTEETLPSTSPCTQTPEETGEECVEVVDDAKVEVLPRTLHPLPDGEGTDAAGKSASASTNTGDETEISSFLGDAYF